MTKIFISHASADSMMVNALMDLFQTQFNLTRDNFFNTSDEQLTPGGNWVEQIRTGMHETDLVMPIITPSYLESAFCICELGAAWVNAANLIPLIVPPLTYKALDATPYRAVVQTISLDSKEGLTRLFDAFTERGIGTGTNMTRFLKRVDVFGEDKLKPFIEEMKKREIVTPALVKQLRAEKKAAEEAYEEVEDELTKLREENTKLRRMKDAEEVRVMDDANMDEWERFLDSVHQVKENLRPLSRVTTSVLYYSNKNTPFTGDQGVNTSLAGLEGEGMVYWDDGWYVDEKHPLIENAQSAINYLSFIISNSKETIEERFLREYPGVRFGLQFYPCWDALFAVNIMVAE
ncbi:toll/interleukin-1 receptor domain-containing protein [Paenibacillus sp. NPDC058367]|uniref:toll/interleukin-1 receptor domain-containing protein n=1 Tax=Paenibacillus sp. NPDC058367 TaxID=3346460 RepID=UPI003665817F